MKVNSCHPSKITYKFIPKNKARRSFTRGEPDKINIDREITARANFEPGSIAYVDVYREAVNTQRGVYGCFFFFKYNFSKPTPKYFTKMTDFFSSDENTNRSSVYDHALRNKNSNPNPLSVFLVKVFSFNFFRLDGRLYTFSKKYILNIFQDDEKILEFFHGWNHHRRKSSQGGGELRVVFVHRPAGYRTLVVCLV